MDSALRKSVVEELALWKDADSSTRPPVLNYDRVAQEVEKHALQGTKIAEYSCFKRFQVLFPEIAAEDGVDAERAYPLGTFPLELQTKVEAPTPVGASVAPSSEQEDTAVPDSAPVPSDSLTTDTAMTPADQSQPESRERPVTALSALELVSQLASEEITSAETG